MPVLDWTRTDLRWRLPNGGTCMRFDIVDFAAFDIHHPRSARAPATTIANDDRRRGGTGASPAMDEARQEAAGPQRHHGPARLDREHDARRRAGASRRIRPHHRRTSCGSNFVDFLDEVVPVAEELGVSALLPSRRSAVRRCSACRASCRPRPTTRRSWMRSTARPTA